MSETPIAEPVLADEQASNVPADNPLQVLMTCKICGKEYPGTEDQVPHPVCDDCLALEHRKRELVGCLGRYLMENRPDLKDTVSTMLFARHLYALTVQYLEFLLGDLDEKKRKELVDQARAAEGNVAAEVPEMSLGELYARVESTFHASCQHAAQRPAPPNLVLATLKQMAAPWIEKAVPVATQRIQAAQRARWEAMEKARRERPVPLGLTLGPDSAGALDRDKPLVLIGWAPAVAWLLERITEHARRAADAQVYQVVRLSTRLKPNVEGEDAKPKTRLVRLGAKDWEDITKSRDRLDKLFMAKVLRQCGSPPDLLVVDDAAHASASQGLAFDAPILADVTSIRKAAHANKAVRDFIRKIGAAAVIGVPLGARVTPPIDSVANAWRELEEFSVRRTLIVDEDPEHYHLHLGEAGLLASVPKAEIDAYRVSNIILAR